MICRARGGNSSGGEYTVSEHRLPDLKPLCDATHDALARPAPPPPPPPPSSDSNISVDIAGSAEQTPSAKMHSAAQSSAVGSPARAPSTSSDTRRRKRYLTPRGRSATWRHASKPRSSEKLLATRVRSVRRRSYRNAAKRRLRRNSASAARVLPRHHRHPGDLGGNRRRYPRGRLRRILESAQTSPTPCTASTAKIKRRRFTVGRYYTEGGVKRLQSRTSTWLSGIQGEQDYLSAEHLNTASWDTLKEHVHRFAEVHGALWREKTKSRWARGRFDTYIRKPKAVDEFYSEVRADGPVTSHFFGNGSFRPTFRGCIPAPKTLVARRSKMAFPDTPFDLVDEFCTTQCCWQCHARTQPVTKNSTVSQYRTVRGLVFCYSRTCGAFTNRDFQGAFNIGVCGHGPRPSLLARQTATGRRRTDASRNSSVNAC